MSSIKSKREINNNDKLLKSLQNVNEFAICQELKIIFKKTA